MGWAYHLPDALGSVRRVGPGYDLPIAPGVLVASGQLPPEALEGAMVIGKLSLDGGVRHMRGALAMAALAREQGLLTFPASFQLVGSMNPSLCSF